MLRRAGTILPTSHGAALVIPAVSERSALVSPCHGSAGEEITRFRNNAAVQAPMGQNGCSPVIKASILEIKSFWAIQAVYWLCLITLLLAALPFRSACARTSPPRPPLLTWVGDGPSWEAGSFPRCSF